MIKKPNFLAKRLSNDREHVNVHIATGDFRQDALVSVFIFLLPVVIVFGRGLCSLLVIRPRFFLRFHIWQLEIIVMKFFLQY